ncbi:MMPL family transporter [Pseudonocardia sp. KRD-184]|uniref:MMPL family transporter n=1 Tax=Pseudonocardia oceani TaxID=2792013 RepID=A0ABS6U3E9_9PSEU|nr:MMPL family transporter [Pseudonocardia oceani]MBW0094984.1 MMPL family transporter [Pseudonocardia oceani]MBW0107816.1 MMPL family transporter [Pseudonocardia oceani]MBW0121461.1 MMPL family transporter [Pseudonocardia oceani]MBW0126449.1 MMPL family transporter [Pseudonocardia oceani]
MAGLVGAVLTGLLRLRVDTGVNSVVVPDDPAAVALAEVGSSFGGDPVVVLLESAQPRQLLSADALPALLRLEGQLARTPDVAAVYGPATVLNQVAGRAQELLAELSGYRDGVRAAAAERVAAEGGSEAAAQDAAAAAVAEFDQRYGALVVQGLPGGLPTLRNDEFVSSVIFGDGGEPRPQWRFVVPEASAVAVLVRPRQDLDQAGVERLVVDVRGAVEAAGLDAERVTVSGVPAVAAALGDRVRTEVPLLGGIALLAVGAWFLAVRWADRRHRVLPLVATAVGTVITLGIFGWAGRPLSLGVIAFLPVLIGVGSDFTTYLATGASRRLVLVVGAATAASFGALTVSPIPTVRDLGLTLAVGIAVAVLTGVTVTWRRDAPAATVREPEPVAVRTPAPTGSTRTRITAGAAAVVLAGAGWFALADLPLRADLQGFAGGLSVIDDAEHVEDVLGSSGEFTIALSGGGAATPEALEWMRATEEAVITAEGDRLRPIISPPGLLGFLGETPTDGQLTSALRLLPRYLTGSVINSDRSLAVLTFGTRLDDAEQLLDLRESVRSVLPPPPAGMQVELTGLPMVAVGSYETISADRYLANVLGIVVAGLVLALGLRKRSDAALAVVAAALATGWGLAAVWVAGIGLTPVTIAIGSLTAAVGCEFTVLAAEAARRGDRSLHRAVLLAAAASATGYAVLMFSQLSVVAQFGLLLAVSVGVAMGSAVFVVWLARTSGPARPLDTVDRDHRLVGVQ